MSAESFAKYQRQYSSAYDAAFKAVPATYRLADTMAFADDERTNDQSLWRAQGITEVDILKLGQLLQGPQQALMEKIIGVMMSDAHVEDQFAKQAGQAKKQEQIKALVENYTKQIEAKLRIIAEMKAFKELEKAKSVQIARMHASELAASQGTSEQKEQAMMDISRAFDMGPDDIAVA